MLFSLSKAFRYFGVSFLIGAVLAYFFKTFDGRKNNAFFTAFFVILICFLVLSLLFIRQKKIKKASFVLLLFFVFFGLGLGFFRYQFFLLKTKKIKLDEKTDNYLVRIESEIKEYKSSQGFISKILKQGDDRKNSFYIIIYTEKIPFFNQGDVLFIKGKLEPFDAPAFRFSQGKLILGKISNPEIKIRLARPSSFYNLILSARDKMKNFLSEIVPEPAVGLLNGFLFGGYGNLSVDLEEKIRKTGLSHLVAVSGFHLSVIAKLISSFFALLSLSGFLSFLFSILFLLIFMMMAGFTASVLRAGLMSGLLLFSQLNFRLYHPVNALLFAALIMVIINPLVLFYDFGFQLSFLATLGIIYFSPILKEKSFWQKDFFRDRGFIIKETVIASFSSLVFVAPWLIYKTQVFSLVTPLSNFLITPMVPYIMFGGLFLIIVSSISFYPALVFGFFLTMILTFCLKTINFLSALPFAEIFFPEVFRYFIFLFYPLLVFYIFKKQKAKGGKLIAKTL